MQIAPSHSIPGKMQKCRTTGFPRTSCENWLLDYIKNFFSESNQVLLTNTSMCFLKDFKQYMFSCVLTFVSNFLTGLIAVEKRRKSWIYISSSTDALLVVLFCCIFPFLSVQSFQNCLLNYEGFIRKKTTWSELCRCWKNQYNLGIRDSSCLGDSDPAQNFITFRKILRHISLLC